MDRALQEPEPEESDAALLRPLTDEFAQLKELYAKMEERVRHGSIHGLPAIEPEASR